MALTEAPVLQGLVSSCHAPNEFLQQAATEGTATLGGGVEGLMEESPYVNPTLRDDSVSEN